MIRAAILIGMVCSLPLSAQRDAEEIDNWTFGIHGGFNQYQGELGNGWYATDQAAYSFAGFSLSRILNRHFEAGFFGSRGELGYQRVWMEGEPRSQRNSFLISKTTASLWLRYYLLGTAPVIQPYVFAGGSMIWQRPRGDNFYATSRRQAFGLPEGGVGLNIRITRWMRLQFQEVFTFTTADYIDYNEGGGNDKYLMHTVGLVFNVPKFGRNSMGAPDREVDKCPALPRELKAREKKAANDNGTKDRRDRRRKR